MVHIKIYRPGDTGAGAQIEELQDRDARMRGYRQPVGHQLNDRWEGAIDSVLMVRGPPTQATHR